jgi:hypothetical protein
MRIANMTDSKKLFILIIAPSRPELSTKMNTLTNNPARKDQASSQYYSLKMTNILHLKENYSLCGAFSGTWILQTLDTTN